LGSKLLNFDRGLWNLITILLKWETMLLNPWLLWERWTPRGRRVAFHERGRGARAQLVSNCHHLTLDYLFLALDSTIINPLLKLLLLLLIIRLHLQIIIIIEFLLIHEICLLLLKLLLVIILHH
jgi:hypothetical protein